MGEILATDAGAAGSYGCCHSVKLVWFRMYILCLALGSLQMDGLRSAMTDT